jgi:hypothetical protein
MILLVLVSRCQRGLSVMLVLVLVLVQVVMSVVVHRRAALEMMTLMTLMMIVGSALQIPLCTITTVHRSLFHRFSFHIVNEVLPIRMSLRLNFGSNGASGYTQRSLMINQILISK